jgi:hypothetical protein
VILALTAAFAAESSRRAPQGLVLALPGAPGYGVFDVELDARTLLSGVDARRAQPESFEVRIEDIELGPGVHRLTVIRRSKDQGAFGLDYLAFESS